MNKLRPMLALATIILLAVISGCGGGGGNNPLAELSGRWDGYLSGDETVTFPDGHSESYGHHEDWWSISKEIGNDYIHDLDLEDDSLGYSLQYHFDGTQLYIIETIPPQVVNWLPAVAEQDGCEDESCTFSGSESLYITFSSNSSGMVSSGTSQSRFITSIGTYQINHLITSGTLVKQ